MQEQSLAPCLCLSVSISEVLTGAVEYLSVRMCLNTMLSSFYSIHCSPPVLVSGSIVLQKDAAAL